MTTAIEVTKIEERTKGQYLFNVRANTAEGRMDFPIGFLTLGSAALNEAAVLHAALQFAEELTASLRLRLPPQIAAPARAPRNPRTTLSEF